MFTFRVFARNLIIANVLVFFLQGGMAPGWFIMQYWRGRLPGQQGR